MDIEINEAHEIIKNLERGGELSIKEEKYLKVAKLCVQLAAENVALKRVPETDSVAMLMALDSFRSESLPDVGLQKAFESLMYHRKTPTTVRIVAGIKADGVEQAANECYGAGYICETLLAYAQQMREGADK